MKPHTWRRLRQITQVLSFALFLYLFIYATFLNPLRNWANLFYRLDPLILLTATLAGRALIAGLGLALLTLLMSLVFGRVWCGWICPMGTVLEWLSPRQGRPGSRRPPEKWRAIKVLLLFATLLAAILGNQTLLFLDPLTIMTRTLAVAVWPAVRYAVYQTEAFLYRFGALWSPLDALHGSLVYPIFQDVVSVFWLALPILLFFLALVALNWWAERFWCRYLCPLGGLLGLISRLPLLRRTVGDECAACALCAPDCPTGTIDPQQGYQSDPAECLVCYDCITACTRDSVAFRWQLPGWKPAPRQPYDPTRRQILMTLGVTAAGIALAGLEPVTQREPARLVRPPGATLTDFEALCIRCNECVRVCPTQGLQPTLLEAGWQNTMTPVLVSRLGPCSFSCNACGEVCPTGAIPPLGLEEKQQTMMGLAWVDRDRCLPWAYDIPCIVCEEACPLAEKAIQLEEVEIRNARDERILLQRPHVVKDWCIGCGICEFQCPMGGQAGIQVYVPTEAGSK